jgi:hypothetical protein
MKRLFILIMWVMSQQLLLAQGVQTLVCPYTCNPVPFEKYQKGMKFYFPSNKALLDRNQVFADMLLQDSCAFGDTFFREPKYQNLAGKTFEIESIKIDTAKAYPGNNHYLYRFYLKGPVCKAILRYNLIIDKRQLTASPQQIESYTIEGAIFIDEVNEAAKNLVNKTYYIKSSNEESNNQPITIKKVEPGTWETPLLIYFQYANGKTDSIFTGICNANVPKSLTTSFPFTKFFSCESKPSPVIKIGMTIQNVEALLDKPQKITESETPAGKVVEYVYPGRTLTFENNKLVKIVKVKQE